METVVKKLYEAMFLIDSAKATADWSGMLEVITKVLEKSGAEIVSMEKWDERELAYEIQKRSRGTYILCYFNADGAKIQEIERNIQLSEQIMRVLILCTDSMNKEDLEKDTPAMIAEKRAAERALAQEAKAKQASEESPEAPAEVVAEEKAAEVEDSKEPEQAAVPEAVEPEPVEDEDKKEAEAEPEASGEVAGQ